MTKDRVKKEIGNQLAACRQKLEQAIPFL